MDKCDEEQTPLGEEGELRVFAKCGRAVWQLVSPRRKRALTAAMLIMFAISAGNTGVALLLGGLVDSLQGGLTAQLSQERLMSTAATYLVAMAVIYLVREVLNVVRRALVDATCIGINGDMQTKIVGHLMTIDLQLLAQERLGTLHGKIFRSVDGVVRFVRLMFLDCLPALATGACALLAAVTKQPLLGLATLGVMPLALWLTIRQLSTQKGVRLELMRDVAEIDGIVVEQLSGAEYIRAAHTLPQEMQRLSQAAATRRSREISHHFAMSLFGCAKALNEGLFHVIVLGLATYFAVTHRLSFGDVLTFSVLFLSVMTPLNEIHRVLDQGHEASLCVVEFLKLLKIPVDRAFTTSRQAAHPPSHNAPGIVLENVCVEYATGDLRRRRGLDHVSLRIEQGETIGVAGRSGSGKSTWIKALLRNIHPSSGQILIGGVPLQQLDRAAIARLMGYVGQEPFMFSGTIRENIAYGNDGVEPAAIERAVELVNLKLELAGMPQGLDTQVSERGQNLSGGQRQRVALARILLKQPPVLLLDEATSALDNISERMVQRALGISRQERTTIMVAHRLSTLVECDRILVFDEGRVVEEGSYYALIAGGGLFAELVASGEKPSAANDQILTAS